jgi:hypothetical protein
VRRPDFYVNLRLDFKNYGRLRFLPAAAGILTTSAMNSVMDEQTTDIIAILKALDEDWALVDEYPNEDYLVFVNESRMEMEGFFPKKELVKMMADQGLINDSSTTGPQPETFSYFVMDEEGRTEEVIQPTPHVYFYELTREGRALLQGVD